MFMNLYNSKISPDGEETERMRLVCFEAIWSCIIGNSANETLFMQLDGVYKILDILVNEKSKKVQRHLLGAFLDLLENPKARSHALEWRYNEAISEKKSVVNLLVQMWKNEEKDIACKFYNFPWSDALNDKLRRRPKPNGIHKGIGISASW